MTDPAVFGYGSLVNVATHSYADPRPAVLHGWRRVWRQTHLRKAAYLSIEPASGTSLHGLVARVPGTDWSALDQREAAYLRHDVTDAIHHDGRKSKTAAYQVKPEYVANEDHPILLSYLDVVVQGYFHIFGHKGVTHFFETTTGWDAPIMNDRANPVYVRHQRLLPEEQALVDRHLSAMVQQRK